MRVATYALSLALMGCVLVGAVNAQDGNIFKEEDVRQLDSVLDRLRKLGAHRSDDGQSLSPGERGCVSKLGKRILYVHHSMVWVKKDSCGGVREMRAQR
jgi:hypothetical protein